MTDSASPPQDPWVRFYAHDHLGAAATESPPAGEASAVVQGVAKHLSLEHAVGTVNGRAAISMLLERLGLSRADEVWIETTFDLPNVSSCVTSTVFNVCKPSRVLTDRTRAIFVIHEFGVAHPRLDELRRIADERDIPLVEDCAHTIDGVGRHADFAIVSFSKLFPVPDGGLLAAREPLDDLRDRQVAAAASLERSAGWWSSWPRQVAARRSAFEQLAAAAVARGGAPLFSLEEGVTPWFFPIRVRDPALQLARAASARVECGRWHGSDVVVFPCHQLLGARDVAQIASSFTGLRSSDG